jgi:hypothetical protein
MMILTIPLKEFFGILSSFKNVKMCWRSQMLSCTAIMPALGRLRQEDCEFNLSQTNKQKRNERK